MDYVVGSVAALVSGNVTPNRPRLMKRALTPTKHQPSPNVTPKSELVDDRSIFLSPSLQKKKAVVKKSPKRIFQNPDLDVTGNDSNTSLTSPKADKVKKYLQDDLDNDTSTKINKQASKSPTKNNKDVKSVEKSNGTVTEQKTNNNTPKKKKKKNNPISETLDTSPTQPQIVTEPASDAIQSPKKMKKRRKSIIDDNNIEKENPHIETEPQVLQVIEKSTKKQKFKSNKEVTQTKIFTEDINDDIQKKKNKKRKKKSQQTNENISESKENIVDNSNIDNKENNQNIKKKNKKRKKSKINNQEIENAEAPLDEGDSEMPHADNLKIAVNPNAVTNKESDSEHESDDEIESENEEINKKVFESDPAVDESSDEDDKELKKEQPKKAKVEKTKEVIKESSEVNTENEIKRTLFVGNVPFSAKCKKEIKKIFNKHGQIETIRIRTVPIKDGRYTPKLALIKNELHPERTTVNVYIKYADEESVEKALSENNTVLNDHHLRVSRSSHTGAEHDPKCSIFVGNLPFAMEDEVLRQRFEKCGEIESVRIIRDKKTNAGKGFGYVNFTSKDGVELALALTDEDLTIKNRIIRVKRCTQVTNKQKQTDNKGFKKQFNQKPNQRVEGKNQGFQKGNQSFQRGNQSFQRGNQSLQRGNQSLQRGNQSFQKGNQSFQRANQIGQKQGNIDEEGRDGAYRRIMHKRKNQESNDGPPNKKQNINQPQKEKKARKEFVGMTAEKKKKRKFDKGQKKKKVLSEILTK